MHRIARNYARWPSVLNVIWYLKEKQRVLCPFEPPASLPTFIADLDGWPFAIVVPIQSLERVSSFSSLAFCLKKKRKGKKRKKKTRGFNSRRTRHRLFLLRRSRRGREFATGSARDAILKLLL